MYEIIRTKPEVSEDIIKLIKDRWPTAGINSSMYLNKTRLEVAIWNISEDEFYSAAMVDGYALACKGLQILMSDRDFGPSVDHWIALAEKMKEEKNEAGV